MKKLILCIIMGQHDDDTLNLERPHYYGGAVVASCERCR